MPPAGGDTALSDPTARWIQDSGAVARELAQGNWVCLTLFGLLRKLKEKTKERKMFLFENECGGALVSCLSEIWEFIVILI